jgi:hypothetical protein
MRMLMLQLLKETRVDVKSLVRDFGSLNIKQTELEARQDALEKAQAAAPVPKLARDAGLTAGAGALVVALFQVLSALGWVPSPAPAGTTKPPAPAVVAPQSQIGSP